MRKATPAQLDLFIMKRLGSVLRADYDRLLAGHPAPALHHQLLRRVVAAEQALNEERDSTSLHEAPVVAYPLSRNSAS
jgi:hypothetical protein